MVESKLFATGSDEDSPSSSPTNVNNNNPPLVAAEPVIGDTAPLLLHGTLADDSCAVPDASRVVVDEPSGDNSNNHTNVEQPPDDDEQTREQAIMTGAGVASGVVGLLLGGPLLGAVLGLGAAYATQQEGAVGDSARAVGDVALAARQKAREIDAKHHVVDRSKAAAHEAWTKAQELDRRHHVLDRTKEWIVVGWNRVCDYSRRHRLVERGVESVGKALYWTLEKISASVDSNGNATTTSTTERRH